MIKNYLLGENVYKVKKLLLLSYIENVSAKCFYMFLVQIFSSKLQKYINYKYIKLRFENVIQQST